MIKDEWKKIIDILQNVICDEVIGTYCVEIQKQGVKCDENCKDDDCYLFKAIQGIIDLYNKEKNKKEKEYDRGYKEGLAKALEILTGGKDE